MTLKNQPTAATLASDSRSTAAFYTDKRDGKAGRWISGCWYPAKPHEFARDAKGNIFRETLFTVRPNREPDVAPNWAVF